MIKRKQHSKWRILPTKAIGHDGRCVGCREELGKARRQKGRHDGFVGWKNSLCGLFSTNAPIILENQTPVGGDNNGGKNDMVVELRGEYRRLLGELNSSLSFVIHTLCRSSGQYDSQFFYL